MSELEDGPAALAWREALESWAIPPRILDAAPESPWSLPVDLFARRADAPRSPTASDRRALEALRGGGTVLDVGCGAGAASMPLAGPASRLIGVDGSAGMLAAFAERAARAGVGFETVEGRWPDVAGQTPVADVAVCHHVVYNVPDLGPFARALTDHARRRVVVELMPEHPLSNLNDLWMRFHELERPSRPTADDCVAVLGEIGIRPGREEWEAPDRRGGFTSMEDLVAFVRRRVCLTADRDPDVLRAIESRVISSDGTFGLPPRPNVTLWWDAASD
jgi:SAM-dependent methyltransferase